MCGENNDALEDARLIAYHPAVHEVLNVGHNAPTGRIALPGLDIIPRIQIGSA